MKSLIRTLLSALKSLDERGVKEAIAAGEQWEKRKREIQEGKKRIIVTHLAPYPFRNNFQFLNQLKNKMGGEIKYTSEGYKLITRSSSQKEIDRATDELIKNPPENCQTFER